MIFKISVNFLVLYSTYKFLQAWFLLPKAFFIYCIVSMVCYDINCVNTIISSEIHLLCRSRVG